MQHIVILVHRDDPPLTDNPYLLKPVIAAWEETGNRVSVVCGPQPDVEGDVVINHINFTRTPNDHLDFAMRFPVVVNGKVIDISKRVISRNLVHQGDGYEGPVIVKSDLNSGGRPEARLEAKVSDTQRMMREFRQNLPWAYRTEMGPKDYRVFPTVADVPDPVWSNEHLVVEKFLAEMKDEYYAVRTWIFFGDREYNSVGYATCPVVKGGDIVKREDAEVPDDMRAIRRELGFDYGKFDYVIRDGRSVLFDANRTPTLGNRTMEEYRERGRMLAKGINSL